jgi:hypothetical protein
LHRHGEEEFNQGFDPEANEDTAGVTIGTEEGTTTQPDADPGHIRRHALIQSDISDRMKSSLTKVYIDILEFFQGVAEIFVHSNGGKFTA